MNFSDRVCEKLMLAGLVPEGYKPEQPERFLTELIRAEMISFDALGEFLQTEYGIPFRTLSDDAEGSLRREADEGGLPRYLGLRLAEKYHMLPLSHTDTEVLVATSNPFDYSALADARLVLRKNVKPVFAEPERIRFFITKLYSDERFRNIASDFARNDKTERAGTVGKLDTASEDIQNAPAVRLIDKIIEAALVSNASDIHIEPLNSSVRIRFRIDGRLTNYQTIGFGFLPYIMARLKIVAGLDTAEKRLPQDGHISSSYSETYSDNVDFRISIMPTVFGEKAVIRFIYNKYSKLDKNALGFFEEDLQNITKLFKHTTGALLVSGPTGSGKTTTLMAFINELNTEDVNIVTIEDPVENIVSGVTQINTNTKIGLDFAAVLRSALRQDPDVIMVGEIRDAETADIAIKSALTGHLVLSTVHTSDAVSTVVRLTDMGVPNYLVAAAVRGMLAQRLMRRLCPYCKMPVRVSATEAKILNLSESTMLYKAVGCEHCNHTGYKGRFAVYEYIIMDDELRELICRNASVQELKQRLLQKGMVTMWDNALKNVLSGASTITEMYRAVFDRVEN